MSEVWKAHFHLTLSNVTTEDMIKAAKIINAKCTTIDLHKNKLTQQDRMLTKYQKGVDQTLMLDCVRKLQVNGFSVVRYKLERMFRTIPEMLNQEFSKANYGEVHLKVDNTLPEVITEIFKISTNSEDIKHRFYNARLYNENDKLLFKRGLQLLQLNNVEVKSFHAEVVEIDSNHNLDAWWA